MHLKNRTKKINKINPNNQAHKKQNALQNKKICIFFLEFKIKHIPLHRQRKTKT